MNNKLFTTPSIMEEIISKEELEKILEARGEVTGSCLKNDLTFVLKKEGEDALQRVEAAMKASGFPVDYKKINIADIYPISFYVALIIIIKRLFNYDEKGLEKMGRIEAKFSSNLIRLFMRYFVSLDILAKNAQRMWSEHYRAGDVSVVDYDNKKRYGRFRIENFQTHIFVCQLLKGYLAGLFEMVVGEKATIEEVKCIYKGDEYHEFLIKW